MFRHMGKWLAVVSVLCLLVAGCGPGSNAARQGSDGQSGSGSSSAASKDPLKLGVLVPLSKNYAPLGTMVVRGMETYFDEVGWTVAGRKIEMIKEDEEGDAQAAIRKINKFIQQDRVDLLTGIVQTPIAYGVRDVVHNAKKVLIVSTAGGNLLTREMKSPYIFRTSLTSWMLSYPMGEWIAKNISNEAVITAADYGFGRESAEDFKKGFLDANGKVLAELYPPFGNKDYGTYLTKLKDLNPKATYHFYAGADAVRFVQQWEQFGLKGTPLAGAGYLCDDTSVKEQGDAAEGCIVSVHYNAALDNPENKNFVAAFQKQHNMLPDLSALHGYDTARVIYEAVKALDGDTSDVNKLIKAIEAVKFNSPRGPFEFDPVTHQVIHNVYVFKVKKVNGAFEFEKIHTFEKVRDPGQ